MTGVAAIRNALQSTQHLVTWFLSDLSDADMVVRPTPGANHIAWQMGHLIKSERHLITSDIPSADYPSLPAGFAEKHNKESAAKESLADFLTRSEYVDLFTKYRQATLSTLETLSDSDLDRPSEGDLKKFAPTLGTVFLVVSNHSLMHGGQFSVVRRKLGKPVLF